MSTIQDVANLIIIRDFAFKLVDSIGIKMSRPQVNLLVKKIEEMNAMLINEIIQLDLTKK